MTKKKEPSEPNRAHARRGERDLYSFAFACCIRPRRLVSRSPRARSRSIPVRSTLFHRVLFPATPGRRPNTTLPDLALALAAHANVALSPLRKDDDTRTKKMSSSISSTSTVSAPGKVLLAGGYLVLDKQYSGLVIATDARFYTATTTRSTAQGEGAGKEEDGARFRVTARSPQFRNALWQYDARLGQVSGEANTLDWSLEQTR